MESLAVHVATVGLPARLPVPTDWEDRVAIRYQDRQLYVSRKTLSYSSVILEPLLAHELGHHVLGHRGSVSPQDEAAANAEAVRILAKLNSGNEAYAFNQVYFWLLKLHREGYHARGHFDACSETRMLADAFPAQRAAGAGKECIP